MVKFAVEFWWKMLLTIFPAKEARKSPSKLRRKFATNFAENFANFTLEIAGAYLLGEPRPGGFQTGGFPTFFGNGPDCVAHPFGTVPCRCS